MLALADLKEAICLFTFGSYSQGSVAIIFSLSKGGFACPTTPVLIK